ncbi:MAG: winged helix DNA-binding domain-containing protein [Deltaproteobacteria bacterium]|nr:MAG: winged helix DNA-binding domain-containing protein [Deltaproteobacteria bacterium]
MRPRPLPAPERRARVVARHHLARTAPDVLSAVRAVVAQHSSDPVTPPVAAWARVPELTVASWERAMYEERSLWRIHAMRRTLFVVPTADAPLFDAAAGAELAAKERRQLEKLVAEALGTADVAAWLGEVEREVMAALAGDVERRTPDLTSAVPRLATPLTVGSGKWQTTVPLSSRLMMVMAYEGTVARTHPAGSWRSSQYHWTHGERFAGRPGRFGAEDPLDPATARAELARRYLGSHGPATLVDLRWWTGWTAARAKAALSAVGAIEVALDGGFVGYVLPGDVAPDAARAEQVALLPGLDSTTMGWKERDWYLGPHAARLFDSNGNAGPTVWVDGRVVGGWAQRPDGEVVFALLEDIGREATDRVEAEAAALTAWTDGLGATPRFRTPLERELMKV